MPASRAQAIRNLFRVLVLALLASSPALADEEGAGEVLLAPGQTLTFYDEAHPVSRVIVTAPDDAYIDLRALVPVVEKSGIYALIGALQLGSGGTLVRNADGSVSLRPGSSNPYFVPKSATAGAGRVTVLGGVAAYNKGQVVFRAKRVQEPVVPAPAR